MRVLCVLLIWVCGAAAGWGSETLRPIEIEAPEVAVEDLDTTVTRKAEVAAHIFSTEPFLFLAGYFSALEAALNSRAITNEQYRVATADFMRKLSFPGQGTALNLKEMYMLNPDLRVYLDRGFDTVFETVEQRREKEVLDREAVRKFMREN